MTSKTSTDTQTTEYSAAYRDAIRIAILGLPLPAGENEWGGWDFEVTGRSEPTTLRIVPVDGEWDAGTEIYVLTGRGQLVERQARIGRLSPSSTADIAAAVLRG